MKHFSHEVLVLAFCMMYSVLDTWLAVVTKEGLGGHEGCHSSGCLRPGRFLRGSDIGFFFTEANREKRKAVP